MRRRDRFLQRLEDHLGPRLELFAEDVERARVRVDIGDKLDLADIREHPFRPVAAVRTESDLGDSEWSHGRNDAGAFDDFIRLTTRIAAIGFVRVDEALP